MGDVIELFQKCFTNNSIDSITFDEDGDYVSIDGLRFFASSVTGFNPKSGEKTVFDVYTIVKFLGSLPVSERKFKAGGYRKFFRSAGWKRKAIPAQDGKTLTDFFTGETDVLPDYTFKFIDTIDVTAGEAVEDEVGPSLAGYEIISAFFAAKKKLDQVSDDSDYLSAVQAYSFDSLPAHPTTGMYLPEEESKPQLMGIESMTAQAKHAQQSSKRHASISGESATKMHAEKKLERAIPGYKPGFPIDFGFIEPKYYVKKSYQKSVPHVIIVVPSFTESPPRTIITSSNFKRLFIDGVYESPRPTRPSINDLKFSVKLASDISVTVHICDQMERLTRFEWLYCVVGFVMSESDGSYGQYEEDGKKNAFKDLQSILKHVQSFFLHYQDIPIADEVDHLCFAEKNFDRKILPSLIEEFQDTIKFEIINCDEYHGCIDLPPYSPIVGITYGNFSQEINLFYGSNFNGIKYWIDEVLFNRETIPFITASNLTRFTSHLSHVSSFFFFPEEFDEEKLIETIKPFRSSCMFGIYDTDTFSIGDPFGHLGLSILQVDRDRKLIPLSETNDVFDDLDFLRELLHQQCSEFYIPQPYQFYCQISREWLDSNNSADL
ncbi:hypothetical protein ADUPG1_010047 [Aduncisulcus paluster]|uniref:Uncharacterized protein n=1 Tax=Aduncisulcus paluster TaxID=2918883 RepID=A0ABQ5KXN8_9EUKA|nr:hypothetical protein ADUPG1_010047 [Aduncisulcus paluster]